MAFGEGALFSFAVLDFLGPTIQARYIDENRNPRKEIIE
jgi:hypothetical protein